MRMLLLAALLALPTLASGQGLAPPAAPPDLKVVATAQQVLDEVNATRATRGLPPYLLDENLTRGAMACAVYRAANRLDGHTPNDFAFLPPGVTARSAGCAAWPVGMGWGSCCTYDHYQYAGAAFVVGPDGRRYMHLFVR